MNRTYCPQPDGTDPGRHAPSDPDAPGDDDPRNPEDIARALFSINPPVALVEHARRVVRRRIYQRPLVADMQLVDILDRWLSRQAVAS